MRVLVAVALLSLALLVTGSIFLSSPDPVPVDRPEAPPPPDGAAPRVPPEEPLAEQRSGTEFAGIVLGADGKPARAGIRVRTTTDKPEIFTWSHTRDGGGWCLETDRSSETKVLEVSALDEKTGDAAGPAHVEITPGCPPPFTLLCLRPGCRITGRVVDPAGEPVAGAMVRVVTDRLRASIRYSHDTAECQEAVLTVRTDRDGRFEAVMRRGPGGRVAAVAADGVSGPIRRFTPAATGVTDVGDLLLRTERSAEWTLGFEDEAGEPIPDVNVYLALDLLWHAKVHPRDDADRGGIATDDTGRVRIVLPCRTMPATVVAASPTHHGRILTLDLRREGAREARIRLAPFPSVRVRIVGPTAKEILGRAKYYGANREGQRKPTAERSALDVETGRDVPVPESAREWCGVLDDRWLLEEVERTDFDRFVLRSDTTGSYRIYLSAEGMEWTLPPVELTPGLPEREIELAAPAGRVVTIDCRELNRWSAKLGTRYWVSAYTARSVVVGDDPETMLTPDGYPMVLLGDAWEPERDERAMWVPAEHNGIRFGYPEDPVLTEDLGIDRDAFVPIPGSGRVEAPLPERAEAISVPLKISLTRAGLPFRHPGVEVAVYRKKPGENGRFRTDANGEVLLRVFPGRYACQVATIARRSSRVWDWPQRDIVPGPEERSLTLDFEFLR